MEAEMQARQKAHAKANVALIHFVNQIPLRRGWRAYSVIKTGDQPIWNRSKRQNSRAYYPIWFMTL